MPSHNGARFNGLPSSFPGQLPATATSDDAPAGRLGEIIESTVLQGAAVALTSPNPSNVTTISLTPGDWEVCGNVAFVPGGSTTLTLLAAWIHTTSAAYPTLPNGGAYNQFALTFTTGGVNAIPAGQRRYSLAATTTIYLSASATFGASTLGAYGYIGARRVR